MLERPKRPRTRSAKGDRGRSGEPHDKVDLRVLVENYLDGVALIVGDRLRYVNRALFELTGYTATEAQDRPVAEFFVPRDRDRLATRMHELYGGGAPRSAEYELLHKDGTPRLVEVHSHPMTYRGHQALLSVVRELSDRQAIEQRLRSSEERYRALFEDNPSMYFILDGQGKVLSVNKFGAAQIGYNPDELIGHDVLDVFLEEDRENVREQIGRCLAREGGVDYWEFRKVRKDGSILWVSECARAVRDAGGQPLLLIVCEDVTKRKEAEEALQTREAQLRVLSGLTSDCCWIRQAHPDDRVTRQWVTGSFSRLTGYSTEEFERIGREGLVHPDDLPGALRYINGPPGRSEHEFRIIRKDGEVRHLLERLLVEERPDGVIHVYGSTRDITEAKEAEQALLASRERLVQSERLESLGRLAGGIAHDFNNLLMVILGYSERLLSAMEEGSQSKRHASEIRRAAERAGSLTRQLLAFSRKQPLQPRTLKLNTLIADMHEMLERLVPESIQLRFELDPKVGSVRIDPSHFERAVMNLVANARDAIDHDGTITLRTGSDVPEVGRRPGAGDGAWVRLQVADNGRGMDAETQKYLFEPFFTTKSEGRGTGLGMAAVYGTVAQSGGHIEVSSEPASGTTVSIYLPVVDGAVDLADERERRQHIHAGSETLLLAEDEQSVREMVRDALSACGYTVLEAARPSEALRICKEHPGRIDLLISDVIMPEMDGKRLADRVLAERPATRVLLMSGYPSEFVGRHGVLGPGMVMLTKPVSLEQLTRKVRDLLDAP